MALARRFSEVLVDNDDPSLYKPLPYIFSCLATCHPDPMCSEKADRWDSLNSRDSLMGQAQNGICRPLNILESEIRSGDYLAKLAGCTIQYEAEKLHKFQCCPHCADWASEISISNI